MSMMKKITAAILSAAMLSSMVVMSACGDNKENEDEKSKTESSSAKNEVQFSQEPSEVPEDISAISAKPDLTKDQLNSINDFVLFNYSTGFSIGFDKEGVIRKYIEKKVLGGINHNLKVLALQILHDIHVDRIRHAGGNNAGKHQYIPFLQAVQFPVQQSYRFF